MAIRPRHPPTSTPQKEISLAGWVGSFPDNPPRDGDPQETVGEPRAKRPRTTHACGFIVVAQEELSFTTQVAASSDQSSHVHRRDFGQYLKLSHRVPAQQDEAHGLQITSAQQSRGKAASFSFYHPLGPDPLPDTLRTALRVASTQGSDPESEGCVWASIDIDVRQDGPQLGVKLTIEVRWNESHGFVSANSQTKAQRQLRELVLDTYFPELDYYPMNRKHPNRAAKPWSPQDFYEAACMPDKDGFDQALLHATIPHLTAKLFPFQRRSLQWLLNREGSMWRKSVENDDSIIQPLKPGSLEENPISFVEEQDALGQPFAISPLFGVVSRDPLPYTHLQNIKGGILAEEMGLGKTLEIIGLILLHRRPEGPNPVFDPFLGRNLRPTGATLVITPLPLLSQWQAEIRRHAPHLKVAYYPGLRAAIKDGRTDAELVDGLAEKDVVITTYEALRPEVHSALEPPPRSMRGERKYERTKSPLMQLSWWRVCIDEAQMVENWTSNTAVLARLIPRVNVWAITGTPVKDDIAKDLRGLLTFLRLEPYASDPHICDSLFRHDKESCRRLFNLICLRHSKGAVRNEIALPLQKRYVITMPFSAVEEQHYQELFKNLVGDCGLDAHGNPTAPDWNPNDPAVQESMRLALDRLRQSALHPECGVHNRRALGHRTGPLRTVIEVLEAMMEQSESAIRTDQRSLLNIKLVRGQILAGLDKVDEALAIWKEVLESSTALVAECRDRLEQEREQAQQTQRIDQPMADDGDEEDEDDEDQEDAIPAQIKEARRRLRYALEIQHRAIFYCANAYFTIKSNVEITPPESDEFKRLEEKETESYDFAKAIRKEILHETHSRAKRMMDKIASTAARQDFAEIPELKSMDQKGIESRRIVEAFDELCAALDHQANQLDEWREHVIQLLLKPLLDEEHDDITGEEYEDSTKLQDEILVYVQVLRTAVADRQDALSGQKNFLVDHEYKIAVQQAKDDEGPFPKKLLELFKLRDALNPQPVPGDPLGSLRGIVSELRTLSGKLRHEASNGNQRANAELTIVTNQLTLAQRQLTEHAKITSTMEQEIENFRDTMNARLEFYRQLQAVSDMVADYDGLKTEESLAAQLKQEEAARRSLATAESKHRYRK